MSIDYIIDNRTIGARKYYTLTLLHKIGSHVKWNYWPKKLLILSIYRLL